MPVATGINFGLIEVMCPVDDAKAKNEFKSHIETALAAGFMPAGPMVILVVGEADSREKREEGAATTHKVPVMYYAFPVVQAQAAPITVATPGMRVQ